MAHGADDPAESRHAMEALALADAGAILLAIFGDAPGRPDADGPADHPRRDAAVAMGALMPLSDGTGEIKSMHVRHDCRGTGLAGRLLDALLAEARRRGMARVSLETGRHDRYAPARGLYARRGFVECAPFGTYGPDPESVFMTRVS